MRATDETVTAHLGGIRRRQRNSDGIVVHVQACEQSPGLRTLRRNVSQGGGGLEVRWLLRLDRVGRFDELRLLRLDRVVGSKYVGFHGICFPFDRLFELRFTTVWLGKQTALLA